MAQKSSELELYLQRVKELEDMYHQLEEALEDERQAKLDEEAMRKLQARCTSWLLPVQFACLVSALSRCVCCVSHWYVFVSCWTVQGVFLPLTTWPFRYQKKTIQLDQQWTHHENTPVIYKEAKLNSFSFHLRLLNEEAGKRAELEQLHLHQQQALSQTEAEKQELLAEQLAKERQLKAAMLQLNKLERERRGVLEKYEVRSYFVKTLI